MTPLAFLELLYIGSVAQGFVEFRFLKGGQRHWMAWPSFKQAPDLFTPDLVPPGADAYFGVALRKQTGTGPGAGGKSNCAPTWLVWIDVDLIDHPDITGGQTKEGLLEAPAEELAEYKRELLRRVLARCYELDLVPRAIVDSGHGLQVYWVRRVATTAAETEDFNKRLALAFGGDPKSTDLARILRVPGTLNLKNPDRPLPVQVVHEDPEAFIEDSALAALPLPEKPKPEPVSQPTGKVSLSAELTGNAQERYAQAALQKEVDALRATGEGGRNDQLNRAAFSVGTLVGAGVLDEVQATQELTEAARAIGLDDSEIRDTLRSGLEGGKARPRDLSGVGQKSERPSGAQGTIGKARTRAEAAAVPGLEAPRPPVSGVYVQHGVYYIDRPVKKGGEIVDWYPEQLTNWTWTPTLRLHYPDGSVGERGPLVVNGRSRGDVQIEARAWSSRKDLLEVIAGYQAICYTTNNADIGKIYQSISLSTEDLPTARGVRSYGLHLVDGEWLELFEDRTISTHELPPVFYAGTPIDPGSRSFRAPRGATPEQIDEARRAIIRLPGLVTPATARALLGYGVAAAFAPRITPHLGNRLPFIYNAGERESGKTSAAQIVLELTTGYTSRITKAVGMTPYQYDIAHSGANNLLSILDEYRPGEIDDAQLRKHHDLGVKWRGSGVASKDHAYELNAPTIIAGEGFTDDAATRSRGVLYFTRKKDRGTVEAYGEVSRLPLWAYAGHLHTLARTTPEDAHLARVREAERLAQLAIGGTANPRLQYALTFIAYGLLVLQDDVEPSAFTEQIILDTLREGVFNTLEGGSEGITNLEMFLQQLSFCLTKVANPRQYVAPSSTSGQLIIRPQVCVDLVQAQYRERAAIANVTLFKQYAEQASYFEPGDLHKTPEGKVVRGKRLVLAAIPPRCEADLLREFEEAMRE